MEWLIFEEEYYRAGAPQRVTQNGIFLLAPTLFEFGTDEQKDRILPPMAAAEDSGRRAGPSPTPAAIWPGITSRAVRDDSARRLAAARAEDLVDARRVLRLRSSACSAPIPTRRAPPRAHLLPRAARAPGVTVRRSARLDGDEGFAEVFFDDVVRPRPRRPRRGGRRLERRDGDHRLGARPHAAQPRPLPGHAPRGSSSSAASRARRSRRCATRVVPRLDRRARPTGSTRCRR